MANKRDRFPDNKLGKYYVDGNCIACDACTGIATEFFKMNDFDSHAYVSKQPVNKTDLDICEEAKDACPVDAIGNDGD